MCDILFAFCGKQAFGDITKDDSKKPIVSVILEYDSEGYEVLWEDINSICFVFKQLGYYNWDVVYELLLYRQGMPKGACFFWMLRTPPLFSFS